MCKRVDWRTCTKGEYEGLICMREGRMRWVDIARELGRDVSDVNSTWEGNQDCRIYRVRQREVTLKKYSPRSRG